MKKFIIEYRHFKTMKSIFSGGSYRFCWMPLKKGNGIFITMEFYDDELPKLDPNKVQILQL